MNSARNASEAAAEFAAVLRMLLGEEIARQAPAGEADLMLTGGIAVEVKAASRPSRDQIERLVAEAYPHRGYVLVADRLGPGQRRLLEDAGWGWLDRSGHVHLRMGSVAIDREIESLLGPEPTPPDPLGRPSGLAVALALLRRPERAPSVRELARLTGLSIGAVSGAMSDLSDIGLLDRSRRPRVPDLFWEAAARWRLRWFALAERPSPDVDPSIRALLQLRLDELEQPGWAAAGALAAQTYGLRVVAAAEPTRIYVPSQRALTWAIRTWGEAHPSTEGVARLAVPQTELATRYRVHASEVNNPDRWPLASPLVVALTMAADSDPRSREILADWEPPPQMGMTRVW